MELKCYVYGGWAPRIRPAGHKRDWMDKSPESFAYRCLPLNIANSHGWEILSPCGFEVSWNGGMGVDDVRVLVDAGAAEHEAPVPFFGQATVTFHIFGLFRTSPGWNLWVGGPPNRAKDGISPLSGVIETDWSPYTFTMNWQLTRPNQIVRFEENEPICHIFPVERRVMESVEPEIIPLDQAPELKAQFEAWSKSRNAFHVKMAKHDADTAPSEKWQKLYFRGQLPDGQCPVADHQSKLRVLPFKDTRTEEEKQR